MKYIMILFLATSVFAQDLESTLERNPFDPNRGIKEASEEVAEVEEAGVVTQDMPILDGTIIAGEFRLALFTFTAEGKPTSARVKVNEKVAQYTVVEIERNSVKLSKGGEPIPVALYSGQKTKRGGTKVVPKKTKKPQGRAKPRAKPKNAKDKDNKGGLKRVDNKNDNRNNNNRNNNNRVRRNTPKNDSNADKKRRF